MSYSLDSITVDGAANNISGEFEYQGILTKGKQKIFKVGPFQGGTNNIAEFLAIVHALAYCKQNNLPEMIIYSDSITAMAWVRKKHANTSIDRAKNIHAASLIDRAVNWLKANDYSNQVVKWKTRQWGENPADFGRK